MKYGEGPEAIQRMLHTASSLVAVFEQHFAMDDPSNERMIALMRDIRHAMIEIADALESRR